MLDFRRPGLAKAKIALAMPSHDNVPVYFAQDLASLVMHTVAHLPEGVQFGVNLCAGTYVHSARQSLVEALCRSGVTHILWIDTDMRFPRDALFRLLKHDKPIVGINYSKRSFPTEFVAIKKIGWNDGEPSLRLNTLKDSTGLEEVDAIGFGLVLMRTSVLANLPDPKDKPWFWFDWVPGVGQVGEDVYFCELLRKHGHTIYVDHDLSKACAHIGMHEYTTADAEAFLDARSPVEVPA